MRPTAVITIDAPDGQELSVIGDTYRLVITGEQTGGAYATIEMLIPPGGGPGPHAHAGFQESFYVLEGEVVVRSESQTYTARQGAFVSIPLGGPVHSFKNETDAVARLLCTVVPAGLEKFFQEIGQPVAAGAFLPPPPPMSPADQQRLAEVAKRYGQELFPPDYLTK
ncbi:cupin domain-containing protein [uncultured Hymenobacter sp.]|uniref:cupin domain-containing protein n=1 Tax=uncultured Hymenobacter sp. TaxID=170016 RepID=UPI0035C947B7